ncbi:Serine/threonine-protein kinase PrkC [Enhygromyxa salina]|uniref:Serine/threonine-protein kinase PrkC n=2 Tax=Enhygromyxa salina TaxID=215803 RepID=A0A2S9YX96_9BACT|nr:Serine/threonine-protein kinase PrkC [Enhygromyxa salina]
METVEHEPLTEDPGDEGERSERVRRTDHEARLAAAVRANLFPGLASVPNRATAVAPDEAVRIGRYPILRKLGEGGMGVVFAGYDEQLDRKVAIKLLRRRYQDRVAGLRLEREGQALARLSHPNVVQIYELGEHQGAVFVAMEFVVGETLRAWLAGSTTPDAGHDSGHDWRAIATVLRQAGAGLAAAHAAELVHRDFKPDNVIVGADGRVRVLDFGLVREAGGQPDAPDDPASAEQLDDMRSLTRSGAIMGTPGYMAPEQFHAHTCDALTDQFAFCVVAFEGLFGHRPFVGDNLAALRERVASGAIEPIRDGSRVPARLRAAILRGLSVDPSARWPDMPTLLAELDRALDPGRRRRRLGWAAGVVAVIASAAVTAGSLSAEPTLCVFTTSALAGTWDDPRRDALAAAFAARSLPSAERALPLVEGALDRWRAQWLASRRSVCEATRVVGDQSEAMLDRRSGCLERQRREVTAIVDVLIEPDGAGVDRAFELLDRLPDRRECEDPQLGQIAHPLPSQPERREAVLAAYTQLSRARALGANGQPERADAIAEALRSSAPDYVPLQVELRALAAEQALWRQAVDEAVPLLRQAIREAEVAGLDELSASLRTTLATQVVGQWGRPEVQAVVLDEAETAVTRLGRPDDLRTLELDLARAAWLVDAGDHEAALAAYARIIAAASTLEATGLLGRAQRRRAQLLLSLERHEAAEQAFTAAQTSLETWRPGSLVLADIALDLGRLELGRGQFDAAADQFARARELYEPRVGPDSANLGRLELADAKLALLRGELQQAEAGFTRVTTTVTDAAVLADAWEALGVVRFYRANFSGSIAAYERALDHRLAIVGAEHPDVGLLRANLGESLAAVGDHQGALAAYAEALEILTTAWPADHSDLAIPYKGRAQSRLALGDPAGARVDLERALALHEANPGEPIEHADVEFSLARALLELGERERALTLAVAAQRRFDGLGQPESVATIAAWLADHN